MNILKLLPGSLCVKVLVVDDHPEMAQTLARAIARIAPQVNVISATNGSDALQQTKDTAIDILITDMDMPGMNGLELIRQFRSDFFRQPSFCFLITANEMPGLRSISRALRVNEIFFKPCHPERICQTIAGAINTVSQMKSAQPQFI
jgi:CheY-like chemotaxis protein